MRTIKMLFLLEFTMKLLLTLLSIAFVSSCVFVPSSSGKQDLRNECEMSTKKLSLKKIGNSDLCLKGTNLNKDGLVACLVIGGFVGSTSAIVSGSIVLIGNTIHWMEYQATC
jgi:hypothetical protein